MKKTFSIIITLVVVLNVSCKKRYTCTCNISHSWTSTVDLVSSEFKKMNKKQAIETCKAAQNTVMEPYTENSCSNCSTTVTCVLK